MPDVVETGLLVLRAALDAREVAEWRDAVEVLASDSPHPAAVVLNTPLKTTAAGTAHRALLTAVAAACTNDPRTDLDEVFAGAAGAPGAGVVAGALAGALQGVERLPAGLWSLKLGWVMDALARDLVVQLDEPRSPDAGVVEDPFWWDR